MHTELLQFISVWLEREGFFYLPDAGGNILSDVVEKDGEHLQAVFLSVSPWVQGAARLCPEWYEDLRDVPCLSFTISQRHYLSKLIRGHVSWLQSPFFFDSATSKKGGREKIDRRWKMSSTCETHSDICYILGFTIPAYKQRGRICNAPIEASIIRTKHLPTCCPVELHFITGFSFCPAWWLSKPLFKLASNITFMLGNIRVQSI